MKYAIKYTLPTTHKDGTPVLYSLKPITDIVSDLKAAKARMACMPNLQLISIREVK